MGTARVTVIIPTRNRRYTLEKVITSYLQPLVDEIIFVDDAGTDLTEDFVSQLKDKYSEVSFVYLRNSSRRGAASSRQTGLEHATNEFVMYGEDDAYLRDDYVRVLARKLSECEADIVSGRIIYLERGEVEEDALVRFGCGVPGKAIFNQAMFCMEHDAYYTGDVEVYFTHALYMAKKSILKELGFDDYYHKAHGYREETDIQINAHISGYKIVQTSEAFCFHMHSSEVPVGGQRINRFTRFRYGVQYTNYMFDKYYRHLGMKKSINVAKLSFAFSYFITLFIKPISKLRGVLKNND